MSLPTLTFKVGGVYQKDDSHRLENIH